MDILVTGPGTPIKGAHLQISGSKSESNRLLVLQALFPEVSLHNVSDSDDVFAMKDGLNTSGSQVDVHHAGTTMRFLTAYYAARPDNEIRLTGSFRMKERPIKILVEALRSLGAQISYLEKEGYPPLQITGCELTGSEVSLPADVSSQYISALILIAPSLPNGLVLTLTGEITSRPYIEMTLQLLSRLSIPFSFEGNEIRIEPVQKVNPVEMAVESDWSSASYFYSIIALSEPGSSIILDSYREDSLQGDRAVASIYEALGVHTAFGKGSIRLTKKEGVLPSGLNLDLRDTPDLAQTIAVTCFGLGIGCELSGLHTLRIKETDRLEALRVELGKLGAAFSITEDELDLQPSIHSGDVVSIATYHDHRMAMAFAPLAIRFPIRIKDAGVVSKSYPAFWKDLGKLGFST
ncbi:MAG: 3-phosphoshikimate 1-carboxyvinyltransferase [Bacteroidia bacterium]|nr:3-phosphoshikimate 1-carboxyvinyltransferase [Bacteroidia bacterium]